MELFGEPSELLVHPRQQVKRALAGNGRLTHDETGVWILEKGHVSAVRLIITLYVGGKRPSNK